MTRSNPATGFHLLIIGDEILSGKRRDRHFDKVREILSTRGLGLAQVSYLGDQRERLTGFLRHCFASDDILLSCGGIGATPDDHTRQAAAAALGVPLRLHPEARALIAASALTVGQPVTAERLRMGEFPEGAILIPNPINQVPGFSLGRHHFVPGFPEMAWPMLEWVLDTCYPALGKGVPARERSLIVAGLAEATLTPLMEDVERAWPDLKIFSLPILNLEHPDDYRIELGVKGRASSLDDAFNRLRAGALMLGGRIE